MIEKKAIIKNTQGIHCRPSAVIVQEAVNYPGTITVAANDKTCSLTSVLELITLALEEGTEVTISVEGPDEAAFCDKLVALFETHFDFPPLE